MNENEKAALWERGYSASREQAGRDQRASQAAAAKWLIPNFRFPPNSLFAEKFKQVSMNGTQADLDAFWQEVAAQA